MCVTVLRSRRAQPAADAFRSGGLQVPRAAAHADWDSLCARGHGFFRCVMASPPVRGVSRDATRVNLRVRYSRRLRKIGCSLRVRHCRAASRFIPPVSLFPRRKPAGNRRCVLAPPISPREVVLDHHWDGSRASAAGRTRPSRKSVGVRVVQVVPVPATVHCSLINSPMPIC